MPMTVQAGVMGTRYRRLMTDPLYPPGWNPTPLWDRVKRREENLGRLVDGGTTVHSAWCAARDALAATLDLQAQIRELDRRIKELSHAMGLKRE